ncbi:MAG: hypothetical protein COA44_13085 [Arcobacter sp.]|nr:MAG: hypothetical protein COA44_13085 [Arcobacter sp.]
MNKLSLNDAKAFLSLLEQESILKTSFTVPGKRLLVELEAEGVVELKRLTSNSRKVILLNKKALLFDLSNKFHISNLEVYIELLEDSDADRDTFAKAGVSTKLKSTNPKSGFHMNSFDLIPMVVNGKVVEIDFPDRCALFIHANSTLEVEKDVLIVGVENFTNITRALSQKKIFDYEEQILFVERSKYLQTWLKKIPNKYLHFGDFDFAGIEIYQTQYLDIVKNRGSYFIPESIEEDIKEKGITDLYRIHKEKYKGISSDNVDVKRLIKIINDNKRTLEQEFYI